MHTVNTEIIRSRVDTIILNVLQEQDRYGYEILGLITDKSQGSYSIKQPTLYSSLKRLEKHGFISSYFGDESAGGRRRYYTLTEKGHKTLEKEQKEWEYSRTILDKLLSDKQIDLEAVDAPFDASALRPITKRAKSQDAVFEDKSTEIDDVSINNETQIKIANNPASSEKERLAGIGDYLSFIGEKNSFSQEQGNNIVSTPQDTAFDKDNSLQNNNIMQNSNNTQVRQERDFSGFNQLKVSGDSEVSQKDSAVSEQKDIANSSDNATINDATKTHDVFNGATQINSDIDTIAIKEIDYRQQKERRMAEKLLQLGDFSEPIPYFEPSSSTVLDASKKQQEMINSMEHNEFFNENTVEVTDNQIVDTTHGNQDNINYREALATIFNKPKTQPVIVDEQEKLHIDAVPTKTKQFYDLKQSLLDEGYKLRTYSKSNSVNYYYMNYIYSNKLIRDCAIFIYLVILIELLVVFLAKSFFNYSITTLVIIGVVSILIPITATTIWSINPTKRTKARFNFLTMIINCLIIFILISTISTVIILLSPSSMGFSNGKIYVPYILAFNFPIFAIIYGILYNSKNYHLKN